MTEVPDLPDVETATYAELHHALAMVAREYHVAAHEVTLGLPAAVPPEVAAWWLAAWHRRLDFIASAPRGPLRKPPPLPHRPLP
jgi:hypothetical protein